MKKIQEAGYVPFKQASIDFVRGYFDFRGRTTRSGFWWAQIIRLLYVIIALGIIYGCAKIGNITVTLVISILLAVILLIPTLSLNVRRYRDAGWADYGIWTYYVVKVAVYLASILFTMKSIYVGLSVTKIIAQFLSGWSFVAMLVISNSMTTVRHNRLIRYFLREKTEPVRELNESGKVTFKQAFIDLYKGYMTFGGTTTRAGYWWVVLIESVCMIIGCWLLRTGETSRLMTLSDMPTMMIVAGGVIILATIIFIAIPLSVAKIRRYRDVGLTNIGIIVLCLVINMLSLILACGLLISFIFAISISSTNMWAIVIGLLLLLFVLIIFNIVILCQPSNKLVSDKKTRFARLIYRHK